MTTTHALDVPGATLTYDVRGPLPPADGAPPLLLVGQPMGASGFGTLASQFPDRTVITYDPRGLDRSTRTDGETTNTPEQQAEHAHVAHVRGARGGAGSGADRLPQPPRRVPR